MKAQFIPYEQAVELKELGFDERCFGFYSSKLNNLLRLYEDVLENFHFENGNIPAPLWQQAFDWFRVKYFIISSISFFEWADRYYYKLDMPFTISPNFVTYKEARLECLKKLIEIVKEQK